MKSIRSAISTCASYRARRVLTGTAGRPTLLAPWARRDARFSPARSPCSPRRALSMRSQRGSSGSAISRAARPGRPCSRDSGTCCVSSEGRGRERRHRISTRGREARSASRSRGRAGALEGRRHLSRPDRSGGGRQESDRDDADRHVEHRQSRRARTRREPRSSGRQRHRRGLERRPRDDRQRFAAAQRGSPERPPRGGPLEPPQTPTSRGPSTPSRPPRNRWD